MPEIVPLVYESARSDIIKLCGEAPMNEINKALHKLVVNIKEAVFTSIPLVGIHRVMNGLSALQSVLPEELHHMPQIRDTTQRIEYLANAGNDLFDRFYGDSSTSTRSLFNSLHPDLGFYVTTFAYGFIICGYLDPIQYSCCTLASLIVSDTPAQTAWHLQASIRRGVTLSCVRAIRQMAIEVGTAAGIVWRQEVPDLEDFDAN